MNIYPTEPISIGTSWNKVAYIDLMNVKLQNNLSYTLEGTSEDLAWINVNGDITGLANNSDLKLNLKGTQTGTIETDLESGLISNGSIQMEIEASIESIDMVSPMKDRKSTRLNSIN